MSISVQREDFDQGREIAQLTHGRIDIGALVTFVGLVRDQGEGLEALELEHYAGMTERALGAIEAEACARWKLSASRIIHRFGRLVPGEQIMMVATAAPHRKDAFEAAEFLMDFLKSRAPFWKKECLSDGSTSWVDAKVNDEESLKRWQSQK